MRKAKSFLLIVLMAAGLFSWLAGTVSANPSRNINVYLIKASDSALWLVGSMDRAQEGVIAALNDARDRTKVKFAGEYIQPPVLISSANELYQYASGAIAVPEHSIFINLHGEVVPIPDAYAQNDAGSGGDAGDWYDSGAVTVENSVTYSGFLSYGVPQGDDNDWYQESVPNGFWELSATMTPAPNSDFDLELWGPHGVGGPLERKAVSSQGGSAVESVSANTVYGTWYVRVLRYSGFGDYTFMLTLRAAGGHGGCPYVSVWNGSGYVLDNNVLPRSPLSNGSDVEDYYKLEKPLGVNNGSYSLLLSEAESEYSRFDNVGLLALDHRSDIRVAVTPSNEILTYENPVPAISAIDDEGVNRMMETSFIDGNVSNPNTYFYGTPGDYVVFNFGKVKSSNAKLIVRQDMKKEYECIDVQLKMRGVWTTVAVLVPRTYWSFEAVDLSSYIERNEDLKVRLFWKHPHRVDFVGLDTSPQASIELHEVELLSAIHSKTLEDVKGKLYSSDSRYAKLLPGQQIELRFAPLPNTNSSRDFFLTSKGYYTSVASLPADFPAGDPPVPKWQYWFDLIAENCREKGWIWASIAGYPFYYVSNLNRFGTLSVGENGLNRYMGRQVVINYWDGHWARRAYHFSGADARMAFDRSAGAYDDLPDTIQASRPIANKDLLWDVVGYVDRDDPNEPYVTGSITMNGTSLDAMPGSFIHNGLAGEADDWMKGYVATALAIEEARAYIMPAATSSMDYSGFFPSNHSAAFAVTMLTGGWGECRGDEVRLDPSLNFWYADLMLTIPSHFNHYESGIGPAYVKVSLSVTDFQLSSSDTNVYAFIRLDKSGWETGSQSGDFMGKIGWWGVGVAVNSLNLAIGIPYLGSAFGLIPLLQLQPPPPELNQSGRADTPIYANGTRIDPNNDDWGTVTTCFRALFRKPYSGDHTLTLTMVSWLQWYNPILGTVTRALPFSISYSTQLQFHVG